MVELIAGILSVVLAMLCVVSLGFCVFLVILIRKVYAAHIATQERAFKSISNNHAFYHNVIQQKDVAHQESMSMLTSHLTFALSELKSQNKNLIGWATAFLHTEQKKRDPNSPSVNVVPEKDRENEGKPGGPTIT